MSLYMCEFELVNDGDYVLCWPFWPGVEGGTQGENFDDAVEMAADWLREMALDCEMRGARQRAEAGGPCRYHGRGGEPV